MVIKCPGKQGIKMLVGRTWLFFKIKRRLSGRYNALPRLSVSKLALLLASECKHCTPSTLGTTSPGISAGATHLSRSHSKPRRRLCQLQP